MSYNLLSSLFSSFQGRSPVLRCIQTGGKCETKWGGKCVSNQILLLHLTWLYVWIFGVIATAELSQPLMETCKSFYKRWICPHSRICEVLFKSPIMAYIVIKTTIHYKLFGIAVPSNNFIYRSVLFWEVNLLRIF